MMIFRRFLSATLLVSLVAAVGTAYARDVVHDAEYYILAAQHGERWAAEDKSLDEKLVRSKPA